MVKKTLDPQVIKLVKKYTLSIKEKYPLDQVIVFGSQVKGNSHEWSDIDVCLVSPHFGRDFIAEKSALRYLTIPISTKIEPTPMHPHTLADRYNSLATEIRKYGIIVPL